MPKLTLKASVGYTRFASDIKDLGVPNYSTTASAWPTTSAAACRSYGGVQGANKKEFFGDVNKARAIVTLSKTL